MSLQQHVVTSHPVMLQFGDLTCFLLGAAEAAPVIRRAPMTNRARMFYLFLRFSRTVASGAVNVPTARIPRWMSKASKRVSRIPPKDQQTDREVKFQQDSF